VHHLWEDEAYPPGAEQTLGYFPTGTKDYGYEMSLLFIFPSCQSLLNE
jgi:hypothetical protein